MSAIPIPSPAISIVGRHNSGKTTCIERLIAELVSRGYDVGSIKHHSHVGFDIDHPGKDSYRHRAAGASETVISAPGQIARIKTVDGELECDEILKGMPNHDIVIVEGYRKSGLPTVEIMRNANDADSRVAAVFAEGAEKGWPLGTDFTQMTRGIGYAEEVEEDLVENPSGIPAVVKEQFTVNEPDYFDISNKLPTIGTVAMITDIDEAAQAAQKYGIHAFELDDISGLADFVIERYVRPRLSVVIQAGGRSRRMGQSKATVPFVGRPLMCRMIERLAPAADELIITTNEPEKLDFLKEEFPDIDINLVGDIHDDRGALPGFHTALLVASNPFVAVIACDMVFASSALIVAEADIMSRTGADAVIPVNRHGFEPFHSVYRKKTCLPIVEKALGEGESKVQSTFSRMNVYKFSQSEVLEVEPMGGCFINANTPEELAALERSILE